MVRAVALTVAAALTCALLRAQKPELRMAVAIAAGVLALTWTLEGMSGGMEVIRALSEQSGMQTETSGALIRATGVALLTEFGAQLCRDAEEGALAGRIELAGRAALLGLAAPMIATLTGRLTALLP